MTTIKKTKKPTITFLVVRADGESIPYNFRLKMDAQRVADNLNKNSESNARIYGVIEIKN